MEEECTTFRFDLSHRDVKEKQSMWVNNLWRGWIIIDSILIVVQFGRIFDIFMTMFSVLIIVNISVGRIAHWIENVHILIYFILYWKCKVIYPANNTNKLYIPSSFYQQSNMFPSDMQVQVHSGATEFTITLTSREAKNYGHPYSISLVVFIL